MAGRGSLSRWFTGREMTIFFGARTDQECAQVVAVMEKMNYLQKRLFIRQLRRVAGEMKGQKK